MSEPFHIVFNERGLAVRTVHFTPVYSRIEEWKQHANKSPGDVFASCLSCTDLGRFVHFCRRKGTKKVIADKRNCLSFFFLKGFYGYTYALAVKNLTVKDDLIYVHFFNNYTKLFAYANPLYRDYISAKGENFTSTDEPDDTPRPTLPRRPPFVDLFQLTGQLVSHLREDPGFYGNKLTLTGDGMRFLHIPDWSDREKRQYPLYFSPSVLAGSIYAVILSLTDATATHEIGLSLEREEYDALFRLTTVVCRQKKVGRKTAPTFSDYARSLMFFAFGLAKMGGLIPTAEYSAEERRFTVTLRIHEPFSKEGDFRCNPDGGEALVNIVREAGIFANIFAGKT